MSIASEITRISGNVADAYTAANAKGATMPVTQNSDNLATTIATIQTGTTPTGTITITSNGTYNVADKATANVNVPTTAPAHYIEKAVDANGKLVNKGPIINTNGVKNINDNVLNRAYMNVTDAMVDVNFSDLEQITGTNALYSAFYGCTNLTGVLNMPNLTSINANYCMQNAFINCKITGLDMGKLQSATGTSVFNTAFNNCPLTSVNLSSLKSLSGASVASSMFAGCNRLPSINLENLVSISGQYSCESMFSACSNLSSIDLSSLTVIDSANSGSLSNMFSGTALVAPEFKSLKTLNGNYAMGGAFNNCQSLTDVYFYKLKTVNSRAFQSMLIGTTNVTLHFPKNLDPQTGSTVISSLVGYPTFSGTNTIILFDLPATVVLTGGNSIEYERNPKYDTATALAWRVKDGGTATVPVIDWTPYYTSGLTDPTVGTTIYSDAACTQSVTTITAIA